MTKPGADFIESLHVLFGEAGKKGLDPEKEFIYLRGIIVEIISNCNRNGKVLADCRPLQFTDGSKPETRLEMSALGSGLYDKRPQLKVASTAYEFIEILKGRNESGSARKDSKKKTTGKKRSLSPPESPKNKVQKRLEAAAATKATTAIRDSPKKRIKFTKGGAKDVTSSPVPKTAQQTNNHTAPKTPNNGESSNKSKQEMLSPKEIEPSSGKVSENNGTTNTQESNDGGEADNSATFSKSSHHEEDTPMEDAPVANTENHLPPCCKSDILEVVTEIKDVTANQWDEFKPRLLDMLDKLHADPTPAQSEEAVRRLQSAIASIEQERSLIPTEAWEKYEEKLIKKAKDGVFDADWSTRKSKIGKIIWLEEEEMAMMSKDWDRLRAAARTWTILAEVAGPLMEEGDEQRSNEWLLEKFRDIEFMKRMFACKERLAAIKA